jgi:hypothetical protein
LSSFKQSSSTYIYDHIHEWRRRRHLIKVPLLDQLLAEWFTKSLIGLIARDFSMGGVIAEEQAISLAQYLDLIYSQTETLYDLIPNVLHPSTNPTPTPPAASHIVDGVIGTFHVETHSTHASHTNPKSNNYNVQNTPTPTPSSGKTVEVHSVQSTPTRKNQDKKKGKGKNKEEKKNNPQSESPKRIMLMRKINVNLITLVLFVNTTIMRKIVHDMSRSLSSSKGLGSILHLSSCQNSFLLRSRPDWSFMTNPLLLPHIMSLCLLVTLKITKLQS